MRKAKLSRKRKFNPLFLLLLLATTFILIFSTVQIPVSAISISLSPPNGPVGTTVTVTSSTGFTGASCTITSPTSGLIAPGYGCVVASGMVSGTFSIGPGIGPGAYTVTVSDLGPPVHSASSTFIVLQPTIILTPQSGPVSSVVTVKSGGVKFSLGDTSCTLSLPVLVPVGSPVCSISSGTVTGQFQVAPGNVPNPYEVDVTGTPSGAMASAIFTVTATTTVISVTPPDGPFKTKITVQGSGFTTSDTSCQITGSVANLIAASPAPTCIAGSGKVSGTFYVGISLAGFDMITVTGTPGGDSASVSFTVDPSPGIIFLPSASEPPGATITFVLTGQFSSGDDTSGSVLCSLTSTPGGLFQSSACRIGSGGTSLTGTFFVVAAVASGNSYTVTVKGTLGDSASATFTVAPPVVGPAIFLSPSDGPVGTRVTVTGTGFPSRDSNCILSASALLFAGSPAPTCSISSSATTTVTGTSTATITASFTVASGALPGPVTVTVTSSSGASAFQTFIVDASPALLFTPGSPQTPGNTIQVSLLTLGFSSGDSSSCTISSTPGGFFQSSACHLSQSPQSLTGTFFVVGNVPTGSTYTITVKGSLGDSASAIFSVAPPPTGPQLNVAPSDGPAGATITLQGTAFSGLDTSCIITSTPANIITSPICSVSNKGVVSGSFKVASGANPTLNPYTITVTGSSGDSGSFTLFNVDATPSLAFGCPAACSFATPGTHVDVSISVGQFSSGDTSCTISSSPGGLIASSTCHIGSAGTDLAGTFFVVASVPSGSTYTVIVTGNLGDTAVGTFQVIVGPLLTLTPSYGSPGDTISFVAKGLLVSDTSCSITSNPGANGAALVTSSSCAISAGTGTGTFTVGPAATADSSPWTVTVTGNSGGDTVSTTFTVVPFITLTPTNGVVSTPVSFTGSGFGSLATACTVSILPFVAFTTAGCNLVVPAPNGNGQVTGTFTIAPGAPAGTYVITVTDNSAPSTFAASTGFTLGTPVAQVTISPNVALPGTSVGVSGFGFNGGDTGACTIVGFPAGSTFTCNISGGTAGGSVVLASNSPAGIYLITVTGSTGDFASNYLEVVFLTGTLTSITTTSTTSFTSTTYTTMTTSTSLSLSSTTFTFTGISSAVSYTLTTQTFTGESTAAIVSITTSIITSVVGTVTTVVTTISTLGQMVRPVFASNQTAYDAVGLIAVFMLLGSMFLRRLVF